MNQNDISKLKKYLVDLINTSKFESDMLYPGAASEEINVALNKTLDESIENIITILGNSLTEKSICDQITNSLNHYDKFELDTEDRESVCF